MILNGSPRAPKSNSKRYAGIFTGYWKGQADYFNITRKNHAELCGRMGEYPDVLLVFPLYADALPVGLLDFLKYLEANPPAAKPRISVLINCGFLEYQQNYLAVRMLRLFCERNGYPLGAVLMVGSGEAFLDYPFRFMVRRKIRKLARAISDGKYGVFHTTMPLTKRLFVAASTSYWTSYGRKNGITPAQMRTMEIEGRLNLNDNENENA